MRAHRWLAAMLAALIAAPAVVAADADTDKLRHATVWLNSPPLTPADLQGKVVLVDFWTYTCINWLRTLPYLRAWSAKYADQGLVIVGVHTPEFGFEHDLGNVREAIAAMGIDYPVAVDNDYAVWRAFRNNAWPALYFIDAQGRLRFRHIGEGSYESVDTAIQELLAETGRAPAVREPVAVEAAGVEVAADWANLRTPETYLGYERTARLASAGGGARGVRRKYALPAMLALNRWALSGEWTMQRESVRLHATNGRIAFRFHARDVHLVMGAEPQGGPVPFRILIDGQPPRAAHGSDVDEQGRGVVSEQRLYHLVRQPAPIGERLFEIEFLERGVEAFAFTFG
jgi:thiol-disulfide isomerase/thioredoxin